MMLMGLLLIGFVIYMFFTQQNTNVDVSRATHYKASLEIAKTRLASGEITIEEFEKVKKVIMLLT